MKFAIPTAGKKLTEHFGHCEHFAIVTVSDKSIEALEYVDPPVHQPGVYPRFLADLEVDAIIARGMGQRARQLFAQNNIEVIVGVDGGDPEELVKQYLSKTIKSGNNPCDH